MYLRFEEQVRNIQKKMQSLGPPTLALIKTKIISKLRNETVYK